MDRETRAGTGKAAKRVARAYSPGGMNFGISTHLTPHGFAVLRGVPCDADNASLLRIARSLGEISSRALPWRSGLVEEQGVQRVEARGAVPRDQFGKPLLSGHHAAFALHSDESFLPRPCRYVLLHCWRPDPDGGGETLLAERASIESRAEAETLHALRTLRLPYPAGDAVTLDKVLLRYHRDEVVACASRRGTSLTVEQQRWMARFEQLFAAASVRIRLEQCDLLILDNHRVLHGRTAFTARSPRLLKRVRNA